MSAAAPPYRFASRQNLLELSAPLQRLAIGIAILLLFTSSFDIFLVVNAGGNYRFCQLISLFLASLALVKAGAGRSIPVLGFVPACIWFVFQLVFVPVTDFWPKSLGYCLWLLLNLALMFSFVQLFSNRPQAVAKLLRSYVYSFGFVSIFGLVQFAMPVLGLPGFLITQWWIPGSLPRVNGFSYEPSYFASYLLIGFVFVGSLRRSGSTLLPARALLAVHWLTALGIIVSSSRMGILFLVGDVMLGLARPWLSFFKDFRRFRIVRAKVRPLTPSLLALTFLFSVLGGTMLMLRRNPALTLLFLNGTGISDTAAHSVVEREDSFEETLKVFIDHPFVGRSLGGVSYAIADLEGVAIHSFEESKNFEGMNVFAEVMAASGVFGAIPFLCFLFTTAWKPIRLARTSSPYDAAVLRALVRSLLFAWAILQFNQNLLRPYLWTHLALLATVYASALMKTAREMARQTFSR